MSQLMLYFPFGNPALLWEMWRSSVIAAGMVLVVLLVFKLCILRLLRGLRDKLEYAASLRASITFATPGRGSSST